MVEVYDEKKLVCSCIWIVLLVFIVVIVFVVVVVFIVLLFLVLFG